MTPHEPCPVTECLSQTHPTFTLTSILVPSEWLLSAGLLKTNYLRESPLFAHSFNAGSYIALHSPSQVFIFLIPVQMHNLCCASINLASGLSRQPRLCVAYQKEEPLSSMVIIMFDVDVSCNPSCGHHHKQILVELHLSKGRLYRFGVYQPATHCDLTVLVHQICAGEMCKGGPLALRAAKAAMNGGLDVDLHTGLQLEESCYTQLLHSKDRGEGLAAFEAKRPPRFTGN